MAFDYCHPTAPHKKLRIPNWYVSVSTGAILPISAV